MSVKIKCDLLWVTDAVVINTHYNKRNDRYELKICNVSDKAVEHLKKEYNIWCRNNKEGRGFYFNARSQFPFKFVDNQGNEINPEVIGNGSKAIVNLKHSRSHPFSDKWGNSPIVDSKVEITELVAPRAKQNQDDAPFEEDTTL